LSHERSDIAGAESFYSLEGNMCGTAMNAVALPGSKATSRAKGSRRNLGGLESGRQRRVSVQRSIESPCNGRESASAGQGLPAQRFDRSLTLLKRCCVTRSSLTANLTADRPLCVTDCDIEPGGSWSAYPPTLFPKRGYLDTRTLAKKRHGKLLVQRSFLSLSCCVIESTIPSFGGLTDALLAISIAADVSRAIKIG
jgi:hypothetical protein